MIRFIRLFRLAVNLFRKPSEYLSIALNISKEKDNVLFYYLILPLALIAAVLNAWPYLQTDGLQTGSLVFCVFLTAFLLLNYALTKSGAYILKGYEEFAPSYYKTMEFVTFWILTGEILKGAISLLLGILAYLFLNWLIILGSIMIAQYVHTEIIRSGIKHIPNRLRNLSIKMTLALIVCTVSIPYLATQVARYIAQNVF